MFPMLSKEIREWFSSHRLLIMCAVFVFLTVAQPISVKMLPTLLANSTELPKGTIIQIPTPPVTEIMGNVIKKFDIMGFFVTIMVVMNTIAGERLSGVCPMVLVKPISRGNYFFSKAVAYNLLVALCFLVAMAAAGYYTEVLFEAQLKWGAILKASLYFLPNLFLVVSVTLFASSFLRSPVGAGGVGFVCMLVLNYVPQFAGFKDYSPLGLTETASMVIKGWPGEIVPLLASIGLNAIFLIAGWQIFRRQEI